MTLVASRYNIKIPLLDGGCLLYNSARSNFMRLDAHELESLDRVDNGTGREVDNKTLRDLFNNSFIVPSNVDELQLLRDQYEKYRFDTRTMTMTIAPTMACNFKCDYCFQGQDKPHETMSMRVQDAIIAFIENAAEQGLKSLGVAWYGGEPLLRLNVIEALSDRIIAICDQNQIKYSAMVVTNGYKLDLAAATSLSERCKVKQIQVTLDGTPEYHDNRRYLLGGQGSFERILNNLRDIVDDTTISYSIRVNIDSRNQGDIKKLIDLMVEKGLGHRPNLGMYFAPIEAMTEGCHNVSELTMTKGMYGTLEADLQQYGYAAGLVPLPYPPKFHGVCGAVRPQGLVVLPTGDIHKCWDTVSWPDKKAGTIFDPKAFVESEISLMWMRWSPFDNNSCRNCKILPNCTGSCAYKFVHADTTRGEAAALPCPSWKYNIKERLLWRAVAMGKVKLEDYDNAAVATVPSELCTDDAVTGGKDLPPEMAVHYEQQKRYLPVIRS